MRERERESISPCFINYLVSVCVFVCRHRHIKRDEIPICFDWRSSIVRSADSKPRKKKQLANSLKTQIPPKIYQEISCENWPQWIVHILAPAFGLPGTGWRPKFYPRTVTSSISNPLRATQSSSWPAAEIRLRKLLSLQHLRHRHHHHHYLNASSNGDAQVSN